MAPTSGKKGVKDLRNGAVLQMVEAGTLGLPLEVWKTRMGRFRNESNLVAFRNVYQAGGGGMAGVRAFWAGFTPKMVESGTKGAVLLVAKESLKDVASNAGVDPFLGAVIAGAGGGIAQVSVMGPCTFLVTAAVTAGDGKSALQVAHEAYAKNGIRGFYPGGSAIAFRQATNWASRQGFTEGLRIALRKRKYGDKNAKLSTGEELACGLGGGALSCWNHPFEVARIEMQARAASGESRLSMVDVFRLVTREHGVAGLFKGVLPRVCLGAYQALFMVAIPHVINARK